MLEINFQPFPVLHTSRLHLGPLDNTHAEALFEMRRNDDVMRYIERPRPQHIDEIYDLIRDNRELSEKNNGIVWAICLAGTRQCIGTIGFWRMKKEHHRAEIGYLLHPAHWRKGIITEAMAGVIRYAFEEMKLNSIEADVNPQNVPSCLVLEKMGFVKEAHFRENWYWNGKFLDSAIYCMLRSDWAGRHPFIPKA